MRIGVYLGLPMRGGGGSAPTPPIEWNWQQFDLTCGDEGQWVGYSNGVNGVPQPSFGAISLQPTAVTELLALYDDTNSSMVIAVFNGDYAVELAGLQVSIGGFVMTSTETQFVGGQTVVRFPDMPGDWQGGDVYQILLGWELSPGPDLTVG